MPATTKRRFAPQDISIEVVLLSSVCDSCGVEMITASQHEENLRRLAARKPHYGDLPMGEEIVAWRKRQGFTISDAAKQIGLSRSMFYRIETERSYPSKEVSIRLNNFIGIKA